MIRAHLLKPAAGAIKKTKRIGRGTGSGKGGTSTRGHKGDKARSGYKFRAGFEGGQMPMYRRLPKFGFRNPFRVEYTCFNLDALQYMAEKYPDARVITPEWLLEHRFIRSLKKPIKILARGEVKKGLTVHAHRFSEKAREQIIKMGGQVMEIKHEL